MTTEVGTIAYTIHTDYKLFNVISKLHYQINLISNNLLIILDEYLSYHIFLYFIYYMTELLLLQFIITFSYYILGFLFVEN